MVQHLVGKEVLRKCVFPAPLCAQGELTARRLPSFTERGGAAGGQRKGEEELGNLLLLYLRFDIQVHVNFTLVLILVC